MCENFNEYFKLNARAKSTHNNNCLVKLPPIKLEFARNSFYYFGDYLYNALSLEIRKELHFYCLKTSCSNSTKADRLSTL